MSGDVSLAIAFVAGLLSFVSPCVLALLPVYLAFLGQAAGEGPITAAGGASAAVGARNVVVPPALLFIAGFALVFILLGVSVGLVGQAVFRVNEVRQVVGIAVIAVGIASLGWMDRLMARLRVGVDPSVLPVARGTRAFGLGALVAVGWTPCIGPVLGAILTMGASSQDTAVAALLLAAYSAGLAVPFIAAAVALRRLEPAVRWLRRHHRGVQVVTGLFIIGVGVLIYLNAFARLAGLFTFVLW
jgi:cytochrome c-type biogenesis protein